MKNATLRTTAVTILGQMEGVTVHPKGLIRHRVRGGGLETSGGVYYGSHYFNSCDVADNSPELQLTRDGLRATIDLQNDCFSVYVIGLEDLGRMVKRPTNSILDWSYFSLVTIAEGMAMVFLQNRSQFGSALAAAAGTNRIDSCEALRYA